MFSRIVVGVDGSEHARHALAAAVEIARKFRAEIVVLHVATPAPSDVFALDLDPAMNRDRFGAESREIQTHVLCSADDELDAAQVRYRLRGVTGHAAEEIVRVAQEEQADLVSVGCRGLGGFQRLLIGSVSDGVVHHSPCPVLVVR